MAARGRRDNWHNNEQVKKTSAMNVTTIIGTAGSIVTLGIAADFATQRSHSAIWNLCNKYLWIRLQAMSPWTLHKSVIVFADRYMNAAEDSREQNRFFLLLFIFMTLSLLFSSIMLLGAGATIRQSPLGASPQSLDDPAVVEHMLTISGAIGMFVGVWVIAVGALVLLADHVFSHIYGLLWRAARGLGMFRSRDAYEDAAVDYRWYNRTVYRGIMTIVVAAPALVIGYWAICGVYKYAVVTIGAVIAFDFLTFAVTAGLISAAAKRNHIYCAVFAFVDLAIASVIVLVSYMWMMYGYQWSGYFTTIGMNQLISYFVVSATALVPTFILVAIVLTCFALWICSVLAKGVGVILLDRIAPAEEEGAAHPFLTLAILIASIYLAVHVI